MNKNMNITLNPVVNAIRFESGNSIYDEALYGSRYVARYWSASGQILPEMHLEEKQFFDIAGDFPLDAFELTVNGKRLEHFSLLRQGYSEDTTGLFGDASKVWKVELQAQEMNVGVNVCTRLDGSPFMVRWLEIVNKTDAQAGIDSVYPMSGRLWLHYSDPWVAVPMDMKEVSDKQTFDIAYARSMKWGTEGDFYYEALPKGEFHFDGGRQGRSGWSRPAFWMRDNQGGETVAVEFAYSGNWEFVTCWDKSDIAEQAGYKIGIPQMDGEYIRVMAPGETVVTPLVHVAHFPCCSLDVITQAYHRHLRNTVMIPSPAGREVEIEANHRGYLCDRESEEGILADVDVAHAAGAEMYVVDAGWYGQSPNNWWDNVGDWFYGEWLPRGLKPIADYAHSKGMKFGLWIEIEAVGAASRLGKEHPEWRLKRGDEYCGKYEPELGEGGRALDLSRPDVIAYIESTVSGFIEELDLDMYRIDHNHIIGLGGYRDVNGMRENVMWRYYENFYAMHKRLKAKYPHVVFQNCAGGGGRLDFGMLNCFNNTEASDWTRPPRVGKIMNNLSMLLPPEKMLFIFGTETSGLEREYDLQSQLSLVMGARPIFRGIAPSMSEASPMLMDTIRSCLDLYKTFLRPILKNAVIYHHTPMLPLFKPAEYSAIEYASEAQDRSFLIFRRLISTELGRARIYPRSLKASETYTVKYRFAGQSWNAQGHELMQNGIVMEATASEIVTFEPAE